MSVTIQHEDFDLNAEVAALRASSNNVGAIVSFVGLVRDMSPDGQVESIFLEYYPGMCALAAGGHTRDPPCWPAASE